MAAAAECLNMILSNNRTLLDKYVDDRTIDKFIDLIGHQVCVRARARVRVGVCVCVLSLPIVATIYMVTTNARCLLLPTLAKSSR